MEKKLFNNVKAKTENNIIWCLTHSDVLHPRLNSILGIFLYNLDTQSYSYLNFSHPDIEKINKSYYLDKVLLSPSSYIFSKKEIMHMHECSCLDLDSLYYLENAAEIPYENFKTNAHIFFERKYETNKINNIIPITKHLESFKKMVEFILPYANGSETFYSNTVNNVLHELEKSSIKINRRKFDRHFELHYEKNNLKENQLYPYYNPYSTTGRFICSYNGLNLQTLNKENGSKEAFIPNNDLFVEIDYDGYHVRLIGELVGYNFGQENVHKYLAKHYFEGEITEENIKKSKELTFHQLYGGIFSKYLYIEFFKKTQEYIDLMWKIYQIQGYIETPLAKRKIKQEHIKECTPQKLFNYLIQAYETERNTLILEKVFVYLRQYKTQMCLYVYDAFIFDVAQAEINILKDLENILSENNKFPVKIKHSNTLNNFKSFYYDK
jgi:hypothetical protein